MRVVGAWGVKAVTHFNKLDASSPSSRLPRRSPARGEKPQQSRSLSCLTQETPWNNHNLFDLSAKHTQAYKFMLICTKISCDTHKQATDEGYLQRI